MSLYSLIQFSSVMSDSLRPHESQHARPPSPSPTPGIYPNSCTLSQWCHPIISCSSFPSPPAFNLSQHQDLFKWVSSSHQVAKVLEFQLQLSPSMNTQGWSPLGWTGRISLQSKGLSRAFSKWIKRIPFFFYFIFFYFLNFKIFNSYMRSQTWTPLPPPSP